jgi:hypothetical protein
VAEPDRALVCAARAAADQARSSHTIGALERAIYEFIDVNNEAAKPFVWTKTADDILASLRRFYGTTLKSHGCAGTSDSGH